MLPKGLISQVIEYFVNEPRFAPAMDEAICSFFDIGQPGELSMLGPSQMSLNFFNEWLVFDCNLNSRRTVLEEYLNINQEELSQAYKNIYSDLILTHNYSLFRIESTVRDKSINVTDMLTGFEYSISEQKATREAVGGNFWFARIASVKGEYQIVSADGFQMTPEMVPASLIKDWKKRGIKFSPLVVYQQMLKPIELGLV